MTKYDNSRKTGGGGVSWAPWEEIVIRIKRDYCQLDGLDVANSDEKATKTQREAFLEESDVQIIKTCLKKSTKREMNPDDFVMPSAATPLSRSTNTPLSRSTPVAKNIKVVIFDF